MADLVKKVIRRIRKTGRQVYRHMHRPVPIFVMHQICTDFNPLVDHSRTWTSKELFRHNMEAIQHKYRITSLKKAKRM